VTFYLFESLTALLAGAGLWSPLMIVVAFVLGALVAVPRPLLSVICGFAFGWWGLPLAFVSAAAGAMLVFVVGRRLLRPRVAARIGRNRVAEAAFRAVELEGFRAVVLLRLSPVIPSSFQSYLFSITSLGFGAYMAGTIVGTLPGMVVQVWAGTVGRSALEAGLPAGTILLWSVGLVALAAATLLIGRRVRRLLGEAKA
jgi:uncharacterized membrane protein YdjX (TVP38/TMEM64 family)